MTENEISKVILDSAIAVHKELGPDLLESVYEVLLAYEIGQRGLKVNRQVPIPIHYKDMTFDVAFRARSYRGRKGGLRVKVSGTRQRGSQETGTDLLATDRMQAWIRAKLWRSSNETWHHTCGEWA